jgi:hypothetical protein
MTWEPKSPANGRFDGRRYCFATYRENLHLKGLLCLWGSAETWRRLRAAGDDEGECDLAFENEDERLLVEDGFLPWMFWRPVALADGVAP